MISMKKRAVGELGLGCCSQEGPPLKNRKLDSSYSSASSKSSLPSVGNTNFRFITLPRRSASPESSVPVLSPCTYMTISLRNKKIKSRVDPFSFEQALYFEPYQEAEISIEILTALRGANLENLRSLHEGEKYDFEARNQFGENLVHLVCRMGLNLDVLKFLVNDVKVPLNVRDHRGRTPLHNACMSALPNFDNIHFLMTTSPRLTVFEDDKNKIPFELIPQRSFESWTRFLSEKNVLPKLSKELAKYEGFLQSG